MLRVVPDAAGGTEGDDAKDDDGTSLPALYKVRVLLPDESGALARLTAAVAEAGGNILSLSVHGQDSRSVVDEMLVGGAVSAARLGRVLRGALRTSRPDDVRVVVADPHELVDGPTRALDLVTQARSQDTGDAGGLVQGLAALLQADEVGVEPAEPDHDDTHALGLPAPDSGWLVARRGWAAFTVTERARAEAFLRAATAQPVRAGYELLLPDGEELVATPATGEEVTELDSLIRTCLAGSPAAAEAAETWTAADLRSVLRPPGGTCLVVRGADGTLVAAASLLAADGLNPAAGIEPVVLVHPLHQGQRLGRWLRRTLAATVTA
ncbi:ACT domain-containing protein [Pseudonocardia nematodicida]